MISIPGGVLCAGNLTEDILVWPVDEVIFNTTTWVHDIVTSTGGNGANTSYSLAKLGGTVRLVGVVGRDRAGEHVVATLAGAGVDVSCIERRQGPTPLTVVVVRSDAARAFLHRPGAVREAFSNPLEFEGATAAGCSHFHLANPFAMPHLRRDAGCTLARARAAGLTTSLDTGWDALEEWIKVIGPCLEHLDLLFLNEEEAGKLSGGMPPGPAARFFHDHGVKTVVVKLGARGCVVSGSGGAFQTAAFRIQAVDTTGAGDAFAGAFLAALQRGLAPAQAARLANAAGALSVQHPGATPGLLDYAGTMAWIAAQPA